MIKKCKICGCNEEDHGKGYFIIPESKVDEWIKKTFKESEEKPKKEAKKQK